MKQLKLISAMGLATVTLMGCSTKSAAVTGLALAGTVAAVGAYGWLSSPDAETALDKSQSDVFASVVKTMTDDQDYTVKSITTADDKSEIKTLYTKRHEVNVVVEKIGEGQSKILIQDKLGKDQATILLNQIISNIEK